MQTTFFSRHAGSWLIATALLATAPMARADLMLFPTRIVFDKNQRAAQLELINQGRTPETYRISLVNRRMTENGEFLPADTAADGERFADSMVRFSPRQVTIAPGASQTVRMLLRKPADLATGEYRSHLQIDRVPDPVGSGSIEAQASEPNRIGVALTALVGASIPVIVRQGDTQANVTLTQLALTAAGTEPATLAFQIRREGDRSVYGDLLVTYLPKNGAPVEVGKAGGVAVYVPNPIRNARMPLQLPAGTALAGGSLRLVFRERADSRRQAAGRDQPGPSLIVPGSGSPDPQRPASTGVKGNTADRWKAASRPLFRRLPACPRQQTRRHEDAVAASNASSVADRERSAARSPGVAFCVSLPMAAQAQSFLPVAARVQGGVEASLLVLEVRLDGHLLSDSFGAYQEGGEVLLPLGELSRLLTLGITVRPDRGSASGFVIREDRDFSLDVESAVVSIGGHQKNFEPRHAAVIGDDIYVSSRMLSRWLPVDLEIDLSKLQLRIKPRERLPLQERLDRQDAGSRLRGADAESPRPRLSARDDAVRDRGRPVRRPDLRHRGQRRPRRRTTTRPRTPATSPATCSAWRARPTSRPITRATSCTRARRRARTCA